MNAGLPTTGIGGIFYMLSIAIMPFVETIKTIQGQSSLKRWRTVIGQFILLLAMLGAIFTTGLLLSLLIPKSMLPIQIAGIDTSSSTSTNIKLLASPFIILIVLFLATQLARIYLRIKKLF